MFLVELDGALDSGVGEDVAVREVLGHDTGAGFVFLGYLVVGGGGVASGVGGGGELGEGGGGGDLNLGRAELGVIEKQGGFGGAESIVRNGGR